ncbi:MULTISPECIES: hypothetical protein [unclassified Acinetobacter]|uniref:hypothetical protein n=1 Tax=unclassified Acinetobacter TaxID=196816 RepID=UPI00044AB231|nr:MULTISPECIES: hypothetical protein [unclassified Acinetobacter]EZQ02384.1 hypothetical protein CL42_11500 [Acinetobacter sp. Ver3]SEL83956.1 hypothetical protein SAMN05216500_10690 [Acinetobacter sp. DSM 11652]
MSVFQVGQIVYLASNSDITFEIIRINYDETYEIQVKNQASLKLKYDNISAEMLRLVKDE